MDQHSNSPRSYDNSAPPPYHDGGPFNHGGHYNRRRRYQNNNYQDAGSEPSDSFGYSNGTAFSGRESRSLKVTEEDICSLFGEHGTDTEVVLFKQLKNLQQHGCCLVKYATIKDASQAIKALNNQYTFPEDCAPLKLNMPQRNHNVQLQHASKAEIAEVWSRHHQRITASPATSVGPSSFSAISGRVQSCYLELECLPSAIYATAFTSPACLRTRHQRPYYILHRRVSHVTATHNTSRPPPVDTVIRRTTPADTFSWPRHLWWTSFLAAPPPVDIFLGRATSGGHLPWPRHLRGHLSWSRYPRRTPLFVTPFR
ncbi:putative RNA recognition motif domain, nucleotide-binding alpha-beta plait domain superfamily [Helianthus anomalus]